MRRYILKRFWEVIPTTFGILILTFMLFHVVGGSPAEVILGKNATAEALASFDALHGYDKPLFWGRWTMLRVMGELNTERLEFNGGGSSRRAELPLTYALPPATYRLNCSQVLLHLRQSASAEEDELLLDGPAPLEFVVPRGWRAMSVAVGGELPPKLKLQKQNRSLWDSQFLNYLWLLARGRLGISTEHNLPVAQILREGVGPSLSLTIPLLVAGTLLSVMLALLCAAWRGGVVDRLILIISTLLMSVNYVIWVLAGQFLLAFKWQIFPIWGYESLFYLCLPVLVGVVSGLGRDIRFYRAAILDEVFKPYVRTAQAKGLSGSRIMYRHVLRNSLIAIITYISLSLPFLFTGSLMLESFFGIPGLGNVSLNAIHSSDMAVVRAVVILGALLYQAINLLTDLCYAWLDPRVRLG